jgi:hypothetical protein
LVHKIAEKHLTSLKAGQFEFVPEHQFVQYLLPCFVNCFLGLLTDSSKSRNTKRKCVRFVENLICSYEQHEYSQVLSIEKKIELKNRDADYCAGILKFHSLLSKCLIILSEDDATGDLIPTIRYFLSKYTEFSKNKNAMLKRGSWFEYSKWFIQIDMFVNRAINVILNCFENFVDGGRREPSLLSGCISRAFSVDDDRSISTFPINFLYSQFLNAIGSKLTTAVTNPTKKNVISSMPKDILKSSRQLSCQQLAALFVFLHFGNLDLHLNSQWKQSKLQGPGFPFDMASVFVWCIATNDTWKIKQLVAPMLMAKRRRGKQSKDTSFVSLDVAKSNKCYKQVLRKISPDGTKVLMEQPGEITFVPVKHCRWCGLIKVQRFRLCSLCDEHRDYCDVNYFCSEKCETEALEAKHREEHARYFSVELALEKKY